MSTISKIAIKHTNIKDIVIMLEEIYQIGRRVEKIDSINRSEFLNEQIGGRTFIIHQETSIEWTEIIVQFGNLYEFDEFLKLLTSKYKTVAFIGYNQTTSNNFRFAYFETGKLLRSILQKYIERHNQMRIMDNFGKKLWFETINISTSITKEMKREEILNYEVLNKWYTAIGFYGEWRKEVPYLHLEIISFKN